MDILGLSAKKNNRKSSEYYICCPFCDRIGKTTDTGYHLGVNVSSGVYHCYRCDSKGRVRNLNELGILGNHAQVEELLNLRNQVDHLFERTEYPEFNLDLISWKVSKEQTPFAYNYLKDDRKFSDEEIEKLNIRVGREYIDPKTNKKVYKWCGRVIFPYFYDNRCLYLVGRTYNDKKPKYLNSIGPKGLVVYNSGEIVDQCIICEGIISAYAAHKYSGIPSVAILGKVALPTQLELIRSKCGRVYKCLDGDVSPQDNRKLTNSLLDMGFEVWNIELPPNQDPDSLKENFKQCFNNATRINYI